MAYSSDDYCGRLLKGIDREIAKASHYGDHKASNFIQLDASHMDEAAIVMAGAERAAAAMREKGYRAKVKVRTFSATEADNAVGAEIDYYTRHYTARTIALEVKW